MRQFVFENQMIVDTVGDIIFRNIIKEYAREMLSGQKNGEGRAELFRYLFCSSDFTDFVEVHCPEYKKGRDSIHAQMYNIGEDNYALQIMSGELYSELYSKSDTVHKQIDDEMFGYTINRYTDFGFIPINDGWYILDNLYDCPQYSECNPTIILMFDSISDIIDMSKVLDLPGEVFKNKDGYTVYLDSLDEEFRIVEYCNQFDVVMGKCTPIIRPKSDYICNLDMMRQL